MSYLDSAMKRLESMVGNALARAAPFRAIVTSVDGNGVTIRRLEAATAETERRARVSGIAPKTGDEILCLPVNGKPVVLGTVNRPGTVVVDPRPATTVMPWMSGRWYGSHTYLGVSGFSTGTLTPNATYSIPFSPPVDVAIDRIAIIVTGAVAGSQARIGVLAANDASGFGIDPIVDAAVNTATTGVKDAAIDVELQSGTLYTLAIVASHAITINTFTPVRTMTANTNVIAGLKTSTYRDSPTFTWSQPTSAWTDTNPLIQVRRA